MVIPPKTPQHCFHRLRFIHVFLSIDLPKYNPRLYLCTVLQGYRFLYHFVAVYSILGYHQDPIKNVHYTARVEKCTGGEYRVKKIKIY